MSTFDLQTIFEAVIDNAVEGTVIVDSEGYIVFLNKAYENLLGKRKDEVIGKHVTEVIENTRMHIVVRTKIPEIGEIKRFKGRNAVVQRIPIWSGGRVVAGVGRVIFKDKEEIQVLIRKLDMLETKVKYYENELKNCLGPKYCFDDIITCNPEMMKLKKLAEKVACCNTTSPVLLRGESGVGKELFAHAIHKASPRCSYPFVWVNCAAIPENLFEAELFGYEGGAFTDARKTGKPGKFEIANGGTLFLDEVGDMPLTMQAKTLRVLQEREIERVGGLRPVQINVKIIAATNQNLEEMVGRKLFREDLYYRLNGVSLSIPPLRERREDIPLLVEHFWDMLNSENGRQDRKISPETLDHLQSYHWPGNIRELYNTVEKIFNLSDDGSFSPIDIPRTPHGEAVEAHPAKSLRSLNAETEKDALAHALALAMGNKSKAAEILGINRSTLYDKLKKYSLSG